MTPVPRSEHLPGNHTVERRQGLSQSEAGTMVRRTYRGPSVSPTISFFCNVRLFTEWAAAGSNIVFASFILGLMETIYQRFFGVSGWSSAERFGRSLGRAIPLPRAHRVHDCLLLSTTSRLMTRTWRESELVAPLTRTAKPCVLTRVSCVSSFVDLGQHLSGQARHRVVATTRTASQRATVGEARYV